MGHASSPSLISLGLTAGFSQENAPFRWSIAISCLLHVLIVFVALQIRFHSDLEQPFRAIEVALISLPSTETTPQNTPQTPRVAPASPKVAPAPPKTQPVIEEPFTPLSTTTASERLSDSLGGAVGAIKVPSKLETAVSPMPAASTESPSTPKADQTPLVDKIQLPSAPPEISRPERLIPSEPVPIPSVNRVPEAKSQPSPADPPKPVATDQKKVEMHPPTPVLKPIPEPPTLNSTTPFTRPSPKESTPAPHQEKSLESSLKASLPSVPPAVSHTKPIRKSSPSTASKVPTPVIPKVAPPELAKIPSTSAPSAPIPQEPNKTSEFIKQLMAGVKTPSIQGTAPPPQDQPRNVHPSTLPTPSTPLKSELDQQLAKLKIPQVAPAESIQQRLQRIQVQSSSGSGSASSKPAQGENRYLAMVEDAIDQRWVAPPLTLSNQVVMLKFRISKSGEISQVHMEQSSGNDHYDLAALRAVQAVNPLPPFPADLQKSFIDVSYRFIKQD